VSAQYSPNRIPRKERIVHVVFSILLFAYGGYGVWVNDLYMPGRRGRGIHLHDVPAWVMYGAMLCAVAVMLSVVLDHYDKRNNEVNYQRFANIGKYCGWSLFGLSLVLAILAEFT
jgi:hypothetical protein